MGADPVNQTLPGPLYGRASPPFFFQVTRHSEKVGFSVTSRGSGRGKLTRERTCLLSPIDGRDFEMRIRLSITVEASSVLEAAGLGLKRVREQEMIDDDLGFSDATVEVATKTVHVVPINKLIQWRDSHSPSPRELTRKMNTRGR